MLLTYVDESHSKDVYYVCGLAVHHESIRGLESGLATAVDDASWEFTGFSSRAALHGHPLFHGNGDWERLQPRQRIAIYHRAFQVIADHDVKIFLRGVNRKKLVERYAGRAKDPHDVCLQHLLERVNSYAQRTDQVAMIIADELHEHDRRRRDLSDFKDYGTPGYLSSTLPRIVDTIHFAPSHHSRLIQASDLIAFLHHRIKTGADTDDRAVRANTSLWSRIEAKVEHDWTWTP